MTDETQPGGPLPSDDLAAIGDYFALESEIPGTGRWVSVGELFADDTEMSHLIDVTADRLGTADRAIAASILQQGWAARVTSIWAGCTTLVGWAPDLHPDLVARLTPHAGGAPRLALRELRRLTPAESWRRLSDDHLGSLSAALRRHARLGRRLLAGNTASSLAGTYGSLERRGTTTVRNLLDQDWSRPADLAGLGTWSDGPEPRFRRLTCCGYERIPGKGRCGDCSLDRQQTARA